MRIFAISSMRWLIIKVSNVPNRFTRLSSRWRTILTHESIEPVITSFNHDTASHNHDRARRYIYLYMYFDVRVNFFLIEKSHLAILPRFYIFLFLSYIFIFFYIFHGTNSMISSWERLCVIHDRDSVYKSILRKKRCQINEIFLASTMLQSRTVKQIFANL